MGFRFQSGVLRSGAAAPFYISARSAARIFFKITHFVIFSRFQAFSAHRQYNSRRDCLRSLVRCFGLHVDSNSGWCVLCVGGYYRNDAANCGLFFSMATTIRPTRTPNIGARLLVCMLHFCAGSPSPLGGNVAATGRALVRPQGIWKDPDGKQGARQMPKEKDSCMNGCVTKNTSAKPCVWRERQNTIGAT